jgi:hypothetical protein
LILFLSFASMSAFFWGFALPFPIWAYFFIRIERVLGRVPGYPWFNDLFVAAFPCGFCLAMAAMRLQALELISTAIFACVAPFATYVAYVVLKRRAELPRNLCCWYATCVGFIFVGFGFIWNSVFEGLVVLDCTGLFDCTKSDGRPWYPWEAQLGLTVIVPPCCYLAFRHQLRGALTRHFYRRRRLQDGAFIAELAQPSLPCVGDRYDCYDNGTCTWHEGSVVAIHQLDSGVSIDVQLVAGARSRGATFGKRLSMAMGVVGGGVVDKRVQVQLPGSTASAAELRTLALTELCGVSGDKITLELLVSSGGNAETHALAQQCKPGEIDFFLSHSWHDDPVAKFAAIQKVE